MWVERKYDMYQYQTEIKRHLDYNLPTMILSPRQTGKTTILNERFFSENNSAIFYANSLFLRDQVSKARQGGMTEHANRMYSMSNPDRIRGRGRFDTIYVDELLWGVRAPVEMNSFLETIYPCAERFVCISTPNGYLMPHFDNVVNIQGILDGHSFRPRVGDHFEDEGDLFTI